MLRSAAHQSGHIPAAPNMRKHIVSHATAERRRGVPAVLWSSCLAMLAVGANSTAIMAALPTMRNELSLSPAGLQWAVNAYLVASATCIVLGGQAADWFGARLASMVGLALFGAASCIIAIADTQATLHGMARTPGHFRGVNHNWSCEGCADCGLTC